MKLFAPRNGWGLKEPPETNWWGMAGTQATVSGVRVSEEIAMTFSAVFAATRVISETLAALPCSLMRQEDSRTTAKATDHPLYQLLHDQPNPEQDSMGWTDSQVAFQVNWGNDYSEIQRDSLGRIVALWPIHPSRLPVKNIRRNVRQGEVGWDRIQAGQPGELVYWVRNDDGSHTPIPASDMLHVPGVLSQNGITGQGIVKWGANSIGIGLATEQHAGAFFRNGAVSNIAIKSPKIVSKETADRLRNQWQQTFGGVSNHYKTLLLEDGMEPVPINLSPESTQLILARQFGVTEVARWYRLPPHLLADLSRSSFSNIESENLSFVIHSMVPWIVRREKAMNRQLLRPDEKGKLFFKYNVNSLLRGDMAARAAFHKAMFDMGARSPNDIRNAEDENPIDGGDQYFIPGNNLIPLDKAAELAQATIDKAKAPPQLPTAPNPSVTPNESQSENLIRELIQKVDGRDTRDAEQLAIRTRRTEEAETAVRDALRGSIEATVAGMLARESRAIRQAAKKPQTFLTWRDEFYPEFRDKMTSVLQPFAPAAEKLGLPFDAAVIAADYVSDSTTTIDPLADMGCNELEAAAIGLTDSWANRPMQISQQVIPERGTPCSAC